MGHKGNWKKTKKHLELLIFWKGHVNMLIYICVYVCVFRYRYEQAPKSFGLIIAAIIT